MVSESKRKPCADAQVTMNTQLWQVNFVVVNVLVTLLLSIPPKFVQSTLNAFGVSSHRHDVHAVTCVDHLACLAAKQNAEPPGDSVPDVERSEAKVKQALASTVIWVILPQVTWFGSLPQVYKWWAGFPKHLTTDPVSPM